MDADIFANAGDEKEKDEHYIPHRVFINNVDTFNAKYISTVSLSS